jgi:hypothetical protein
MDEHDHAEMTEMGTRMGNHTFEDKCDMMRIGMKTPEGRATLKRIMAKYTPPEIQDAYDKFIDGEITTDVELRQIIEDNVLQAVSEGRWTEEDAGKVLRYDGSIDRAAVDDLTSKAKDAEKTEEN